MSDSFHVYLNLDVVNDCSTDDKPLIFSETRTIPFLENASDYFLTVARFNLQTANNFPIFIPSIAVGQSDPDTTVYKIRINMSITVGTGQGKTTTSYSNVQNINV